MISNILQPLISVCGAVLTFFHDTVGFNWGLSIIALTIVVRTILIPLTLKQFKSMQRMQKLQPQIKALQAKHKHDRQRMNQEMMKFYQENRVNPLGSCFPLLLQLPIFLALFYTLRQDLRIDICGQSAKACGEVAPGSAQFLFIPDLTAAATGGVLVAMIVLYIASQLGSSMLMSTTGDKTQRRLMIALPLFFTMFIIRFPAGLILYWVTTNFWTIGQQLAIRKTVGSVQPDLSVAGGGSKKPSSKTGKSRKQVAAVSAVDDTPPQSPRKRKKRSGRRR